MGEKQCTQKKEENTQGTKVALGFCVQTLAVKAEKNAQKCQDVNLIFTSIILYNIVPTMLDKTKGKKVGKTFGQRSLD